MKIVKYLGLYVFPSMIGEFAALGAALCWTFSAILYRRVLSSTPSIQANTVRCLGTSLTLILFLVITRKNMILTELQTRDIFLASVSGAIGLGLGDTLYMLSLKTLGVSRAVPITCTYPLFNLIWAFFAGETITPQVIMGATTIVVGMWLLTNEKTEANNEKFVKKPHLKGLVYALSTAIAWSISISLINIAIKSAKSLEQAYAVNTTRLFAVTVLLLAYSLTNGKRINSLKVGWKNAAMLVFGGLIAIGLGWFLLTFSFTLIPESQAVPISSTTPLFSTLTGAVFLHEKVTAKVATGSIIVVVGLFMVFVG
ncbi:MAG: DMT family transporter [Candidatus Bathyarchaeia archaeon]